MIGSKQTTDENKNPITLYVLGTTVGGGRMDATFVNILSSRTLAGWERAHGVHTHTVSKGGEETDEMFSPYKNDAGQTGDEYLAITEKINLYLATPKGALKVLEASTGKERKVYDKLPHSDRANYGMPSINLKPLVIRKENGFQLGNILPTSHPI